MSRSGRQMHCRWSRCGWKLCPPRQLAQVAAVLAGLMPHEHRHRPAAAVAAGPPSLAVSESELEADERVRSRDRHDGERSPGARRKPVADAGCEARVNLPRVRRDRSRRRVAAATRPRNPIGRSSASVAAGPSPSIPTMRLQDRSGDGQIRRRRDDERSSHDTERQRSIHDDVSRREPRITQDRVAGEQCSWTIPHTTKVRAAPCHSPPRPSSPQSGDSALDPFARSSERDEEVVA